MRERKGCRRKESFVIRVWGDFMIDMRLRGFEKRVRNSSGI